MAILRFSLSIIAAVLVTAQVASAQSASGASKGQQVSPASAVVSPAGGAGGVRFTAPGQQARRLRLEIYSASGERLFDSDFRPGSILDWKTADAPAGIVDGSYLCVLTVEDMGGAQAPRLGSVSVRGGQVSPRAATVEQLKSEYAQALTAAGLSHKSAGEEATIAVAPEGASPALTVSAHDGQDGQVTATSGALTFRTGDVFAGNDREQMRVTPEGRVGIGTDKPEAALDVAGKIRAGGGIEFADGTVLNSAAGLDPKKPTPTGTPGPTFAGTGTTGALTKWTDGPGGVAGDSVIKESGGKIGIGVAAPQYPLHVANPTFGQLYVSGGTAADFLAYHSNAPANARWTGFRSQNGRGKISSFADSGAYKVENILTWDNATGNLGVGAAPGVDRMEVAGNLRLNGTGSGIIFPDGSKMTTATAGGGGTPSGTNIVSAINDPVTAGFIIDGRLSPNVARLNGANAWSGSNVFGAGLSANNSLVTNVGSPVNAGDAVNKAYADANFVRFVPGAEQLSVGDANGTAPMINLRGGSTCCSGPGGHTPAWFKVFQNGSFVATGNLGIGVSPMQGKGYRTSWDSYKGAFRSGYADNEWDDASVGFFSWAGGSNSTAIGLYALAFGDTNQAESTSSIVFGSGNQVKGAAGFSAGAGNRVCDTYGVAFGNRAISGSPILGDGKCDPDTFNIRGLAAVAIGYNVTASQDHTTAMGKFASNNGFSGTFIWSDGSATASADTFRNTANNEFAARATGGFRFRTNLGGTTGCNLPAGSGVFNCTSSRTTKENFLNVNGEYVLKSLRKVPVSTWNYIAEGRESRHMGPMAEDFHQAFGLGASNASIGVQDLAGVSIAAVKALEARTAELQEKSAEVEQLRAKVSEMEQRLTALEAAIIAIKGGQK